MNIQLTPWNEFLLILEESIARLILQFFSKVSLKVKQYNERKTHSVQDIHWNTLIFTNTVKIGYNELHETVKLWSL